MRKIYRNIPARQSLISALMMLSLAACAENTPETSPSFCAEIPRIDWAAYEKQTISNEWFHVYRLSKKLYAITEPFQWQEVISYLITGEEKALLFDSGNGLGDIRAIVDKITTLPVTVLASHSHIDHVGGHWQFDTVLAPDTPFTNNRAKGKNNAFVREEASSIALCKGLPTGVTVDNHHTKPFTPTMRVEDGSQIDLGGVTLEVLAIPGHTPDSIALLDHKSGRLFTGDSYYKGPIWLYADETDLAAYRSSIARLAALVPNLNAVHGAHNVPFSNPDELVKVRDGFEAVYTGHKTSDEKTKTQARYHFKSFGFILQANHEVTQ
ncbi:MBL fold metallo-hydrolase [Kordiimonas aquimaris]|uniref:MBL fold metallo-hydrolase n=1 Tax=Kordiimonas aquimaris TaxID=707591 RepID=UPI0021D02B3F|nr:MBL fold metallo-hydrolase [Kordiimonas aquimaris]